MFSAEKETEPKSKAKLFGEEILSTSGLIVAAAVLAFCASSLYVLGFEVGLGISLNVFFLPIDYVQITPNWAIFVIYFIVLLFFSFGVVFFLRAEGAVRAVETPSQIRMPWSTRWGTFWWAAFLSILVQIFFSFGDAHGWIPVLPYVGLAMALVVALLYLVAMGLFYGRLGLKFDKRHQWLWFILFAITLSVFAFSLGQYSAPRVLKLRPMSRISFERSKDKEDEVKGKIIFMLTRQTLVLLDSKSVIAISNDKIRTIEIPSPLVPSPEKASSPTPVASPTRTP